MSLHTHLNFNINRRHPIKPPSPSTHVPWPVELLTPKPSISPRLIEPHTHTHTSRPHSPTPKVTTPVSVVRAHMVAVKLIKVSHIMIIHS